MLSGQLASVITKDGLELKGFWCDNKSNIAVFHSHGTAGDFYTHKFIELEGEKLAKLGISFLTANNRGHDVYADIRKHSGKRVEWIQGGGAFEKFTDCVFDIEAWIGFLQKKGIRKVILQAHSLTQKILYYQFKKHDPRVVAQIHLSPCNDAGFMFFQLGESKYKQVNQKVKRMVAQHKTKQLLPSELAVVCPMSAQPYYDYLTEEGVGNLFPYHHPESDKWTVLNKTKEPLLMIFGEDDGFIKPSTKEAADLLKQKAELSPKLKVQLIPNANHSYIGQEAKLVSSITSWVKSL